MSKAILSTTVVQVRYPLPAPTLRTHSQPRVSGLQSLKQYL